MRLLVLSLIYHREVDHTEGLVSFMLPLGNVGITNDCYVRLLATTLTAFSQVALLIPRVNSKSLGSKILALIASAQTSVTTGVHGAYRQNQVKRKKGKKMFLF